MTNNQQPENIEELARRAVRRIAPTNISTTPQTTTSQSTAPQRNQYPFRSADEDSGIDITEDDGDEQPKDGTQDPRPVEQRNLAQLGHSFFERRSNDESNTELRLPNIRSYPDGQEPFIPPEYRHRRQFSLTRVTTTDPLLSEIYQVHWSTDAIEQTALRPMAELLADGYGPEASHKVPKKSPVQKTKRLFVRVLPDQIVGITGIIFPNMGNRVSLTAQDGTRHTGFLTRVDPTHSLMLCEAKTLSLDGNEIDLANVFEGDGDHFTLILPENLCSFSKAVVEQWAPRFSTDGAQDTRTSPSSESCDEDEWADKDLPPINNPKIRGIRRALLGAINRKFSRESSQDYVDDFPMSGRTRSSSAASLLRFERERNDILARRYAPPGDSSANNGHEILTPPTPGKSPAESIDDRSEELNDEPPAGHDNGDDSDPYGLLSRAGYDSDPNGIYNASPPRRPRTAQGNQTNDRQSQLDSTYDPDETEVEDSPKSRSPSQSVGSSTSIAIELELKPYDPDETELELSSRPADSSSSSGEGTSATRGRSKNKSKNKKQVKRSKSRRKRRSSSRK